MIIVLFHVLYFLGKLVYQGYRVKRVRAVNDAMKSSEGRAGVSKTDYSTIDPYEFDDYETRSVLKFSPPAYIQRYVAVSNVLSDPVYQGKLRKIVDFGCSELGFLVYLKNTVGVEEILCVDIDRTLLETVRGKAEPLVSEYLHCRTTPLTIELCEGSVTDNDVKLEKTDAVVCIELIEHLYPEPLTNFPFNVFGYIKPKVAIITTPNADFNVLFDRLSGFRHFDHKFEWSRQQFQDWAENIVLRYPDYNVTFDGICYGPKGTEYLGACTQMAIFHRHSEKDICAVGVEGLFKTVIAYEYPYRVDNRSDEQKILDEATYYIRKLSFEDENMQDEVPLQRLLKMLKAFYITMEALRAILEEAGWAITDREGGPVVLVPQLSTFSDYSVEQEYIDNPYSVTDDDIDDEDDWNMEPGPPINYSNQLSERGSFFEKWQEENWEGESSIVIPQNNSIVHDNTYLFDGENVSSTSIAPEDAEYFGSCADYADISYNSHSNKETPNTKAQFTNNIHLESIEETDGVLDCDVPSDLNASMLVSDLSLSEKLQSTCDSLSSEDAISRSNAHNAAARGAARRFNRTLDFEAYASTSRSSTSPEPYLLQTVQMDQHLKNTSISNQNMSCCSWTLDNTFEQSDVPNGANTSVETTHACEGAPTENNFDDCDSLRDIYLNTSYDEYKDSDVENVTNCRSTITRHSDWNGVQGVRRDCTSQGSNHLDELPRVSGSSFTSINSRISDDLPQYTSSPKILAKTNASVKRRGTASGRRSSCGSALSTIQQSQELELNSEGSSEYASQSSLRGNSDFSVSTASTTSYGAVKKCYSEEQSATCQKDAVALKNTSDKLNDATLKGVEKYLPLELCTTNSFDARNREGKNETQQTNSTDEREQRTMDESEEGTIVNDSVEEISLSTRLDKLESHVDLMYSENEGKTEPLSELRGEASQNLSSSRASNVIANASITEITSVLEDPKTIDSTKTTCQYAKDISSAKCKALMHSQCDEGATSVQSTSVLKNEEPLECSVQNREIKCKDASSSVDLEILENAESTKPASPEAVETPPNSWSPEIMDSGYPNSASAQDMTPEYDLSSIAQDRISDSESPSVAEAPRIGVFEPIQVENGDLANNNRDGEGNNMMAIEVNELEDLQPLIDVLENDLENENDIYARDNGFPLWLLRILEMANPADLDAQLQRDRRELPDDAAGGDARYIDHDEGFDSSSSEDSDVEGDQVGNEEDVNENEVMNNIEEDNENASNSDSGSDRWAAGDT